MICSCIVHRQSDRWGNSDGSGKRIFKIKICMCQNNWAVSISSYIVRGAWTDMLMYFCHCIIISGKAYPNWKENCQVKLHSCHFLKRTCHNRIQRLLTWDQLMAMKDRERKGCRWRFHPAFLGQHTKYTWLHKRNVITKSFMTEKQVSKICWWAHYKMLMV